MSDRGIRVTVTDLETGKSEEKILWNDFVVIVAGSAYVDGAQAYANGTRVLTIKGVRAPAASEDRE